MNSDNDGVVK